MDRFTISVNLLAHCLCTFPVQPEEETDVQTDTDCCGHRSCKTDFGQAGIRLDTHIIGQGKSDQKSLNQSLAHHPEGFVISVKISDHTEQHGSKQCLRGKAFQVGVGVSDNGTFGSEETGENIAL